MSETTSQAMHDAAGTRQVARGGLANLVGAAYSGAASFVVTALVARIASTDDAGVYFSAISILLIAVGLAEIGVPVGFVYFLARYRGLNQPLRFRAILLAGAVPMLLLGGMLVLGGLLFQDQVGLLLLGDEVAGNAGIIALISGTLIVAICADSALGATRGIGGMRPTVVADRFVNPTIQLIALVLLAVLSRTGGSDLLWTRTLGFLAIAAISIPWLFVLLRRSGGVSVFARDAWYPVTKPVYTEFWRFTAPRAVGQLALVGIQRVDIVLVALWLGPTEAAVYAAATRFLVFGQLAGNALGMSVQPRISTLVAQGKIQQVQGLYRTSTAWVILATWPFYLTFLVHARWLMQVFGDEYSRGDMVLQILSAAMLVATACGAVDAVLVMAGKSSWSMINAWISLGANLGLNIWLIPSYGIIGAAWAWSASILVSNLLPLIQVRVGVGLHPFGWITLQAVAAPVVLFAILPAIVSWFSGQLIAALIALVVGGLVYCALLWRWRKALGLQGLWRARES